jgi:hypothetical protein
MFGLLFSPDIIPFAVGFAVSDETRARLVKKLMTLGTLETRRVPLEVRSDTQYVLVVDLCAATNA